MRGSQDRYQAGPVWCGLEIGVRDFLALRVPYRVDECAGPCLCVVSRALKTIAPPDGVWVIGMIVR